MDHKVYKPKFIKADGKLHIVVSHNHSSGKAMDMPLECRQMQTVVVGMRGAVRMQSGGREEA